MTNSTIITILVVLITLFQPCPAAALRERIPTVDHELHAWLAPIAQMEENRLAGMGRNPLHPLARFYRQVGFQPVWNGPAGLLPQGEILLHLMALAARNGLFIDDAPPVPLNRMPTQEISFADASPLPRLAPHIQFDVMLSAGLLRYAQDLNRGRVMPETVSSQWLAWRRPQTRDIPVELARALAEDRLAAYVGSLHPVNPAYQGLRKALAGYERIRAEGGWPTVPPGPALRMGDKGPRVEALKRRLCKTGDGPGDMLMVPAGYDGTVEAAVKSFQRRHGLRIDGLVGERTRAALNVPVGERITRIKLNMERWRWFPDDLGDRHLLVNIPAFELRVVEADTTVKRLRAIVGRKKRQTPVMSGRIAYLEFNPYWNIPQKIARRDILPRVIADPAYLIRQGIRVFDSWDRQARELDPSGIQWEHLSARYFPYRLRQDPSGMNALGRVKFMFPNRHSIYIHDTPGKALFNRQGRSFSSGCVRVERPMVLAHHLLSDQGWDRDRLEAATEMGQRKTVLLERPIPVHLVYFTAWADADGRAHFRKDIYGRDRKLLQAIEPEGSRLVVCSGHRAQSLLSAVCRPLKTGPGTPADASGGAALSTKPAGEVAGHPMTGI
ncbi:L,D-transpeptidase family protein [Desulfosarcina alkanivorans]|uniref:L,D-transpeptidase family protein n=1 Tax=Desulfosarcina alkanivorans TaxID=571177 RepID=UPI0012D3173A|nr:L,D-transpeptidase family protein [Desulfosarcina alkanivorans]